MEVPLRDHIAQLQEEGAAVLQDLRRQHFDLQNRVVTWVLVGNGVALLFCFNAAAGGNICDWAGIRPFAAAFFAGLVLAAISAGFSADVINRIAVRLTLLTSASRQVVACNDHNNRFRHEFQTEDAMPEPVREQIRLNEETIEDSLDVLRKQGAPSAVEEWLQRGSGFSLVVSSIVFGGAVLCAIAGQTVAKSLCST